MTADPRVNRQFPDTLPQAAGRQLATIRQGIEMLSVPPTHYAENDMQRAFRESAAAGAAAWAEQLERRIATGDLDDELLAQADRVGTAAINGGYLSWSSGDVDRETLRPLIAEGVFTFHEAVPGRYVACYRLTAPQ